MFLFWSAAASSRWTEFYYVQLTYSWLLFGGSGALPAAAVLKGLIEMSMNTRTN